METTNIVDFARRDEMTDALTELLKTGAQALIASAVEDELAGYMAQFADLRTQTGHAAVVRNGHHPARPFQTGIGPVSVRIPKVRSKDGTPVTFRSALVPPYPHKLALCCVIKGGCGHLSGCPVCYCLCGSALISVHGSGFLFRLSIMGIFTP
jgi:hypothetical protein